MLSTFKSTQWHVCFHSPKYLSDGHIALETPFPHAFPTSDYGTLCATISIAFWNRKSDIRIHFTLWLVSCVEARMEPGFECVSSSFFILDVAISIPFIMNNQVQLYQCFSGETVNVRCYSHIKWYCVTFFSMKPGFSLWLQMWLFGSTMNTWFSTWSDNTSNEPLLFYFNPVLSFDYTQAQWMPTVQV